MILKMMSEPQLKVILKDNRIIYINIFIFNPNIVNYGSSIWVIWLEQFPEVPTTGRPKLRYL